MLVANQQRMDIGQVRKGIPYSLTFTLKNTGTEPLTITRIRPGCSSCTTAVANKSVVQPEEEALINAVFTPVSTGLQIKGITVYTSKNEVDLKFSADVIS